MKRAQQLDYCEKCMLREYSGESGLICSLTNEKATFVDYCADFKEDVQIEQVESFSTKNVASPSYIVSLIIVSISWFTVGFYAFGNKFTTPGIIMFILFIYIAKITSDIRKKENP